MPRLEGRAEELGFVTADENDIEYLVVDGYNPDRAESVVPLQPRQEPIVTYDESFVGWAQQQLDALRRQLEGFTNQEAR
jgi:hypothetical protein